MKVSTEETAERQMLLNIEVEPEEVEESLERAYRRLVHRAKIPGFRKGKAPRSLLERYLGRGAILEEALSHLAPEVANRAIKEKEIDAIAQPQVEVAQIDPVVIKATVSLHPTIQLGDYHEISLNAEPEEVSEEKVDNVIEEIRFNQTPWEPVNRAAALGDLLTIDVEGKIEGKTVLSEKGVAYRPTADTNVPVPGFAAKLKGMRKGEAREFTLSFPQDEEKKDLAGKECHFKTTLVEVKAKKLPKLNDEFAKGVGEGFDSLQTLREKVAADLKEMAEREARSSLEDKVVEAMMEKSQVEFPPILVEREIDRLLVDEVERLAARGIKFETYLKSVGKKGEELREDFRPLAVKRVTTSLILGRVAEQESLAVGPDEISAEVDAMVNKAGEKAEEVRKLFGSQESLHSLERAILTRKVLQCLTEIATSNEKKPTTAKVKSAKKATEGEDNEG
ncbi:MAG: trigger factor [Dehalococcoidia bacterium]